MYKRQGYVYVKEEFGRFLKLLDNVIEAGINVALAAHAQIRKFEQPDELGAVSYTHLFHLPLPVVLLH